MKTPIRIILIEDNPNDVEILRYELTKGGLSYDLTVVDDEKKFREELVQQQPDIVISDYALPMFSGQLALEITKSLYPDLPFLIVSGVIGEDVAIQLIKKGSSDYLLKDKLGRLCTSIQHALKEAEELRQKDRMLLELKESEERFRILADNSPVMIWKNDSEGVYTYFNKGWLEFTGKSVAEHRENGWGSWVLVDDKKHFGEVTEQAFQHRKPFEVEYRMMRHDGNIRWILDKGAPNYLPNGEFIGFIGSCIDITDRKNAEATLRETTELLDTFFSQTLDGCFFAMFESPLAWSSVTDRKSVVRNSLETIAITDANIAFAQQFLLEQEKIVGMLFHALFVNSADAERLAEKLFDSSKVNYTAVMKRSDKTEITVEGNAVCLYDQSRNIVGFYGIQRDITAEKKEYDSLRHKADFYQQMFDDDVTGDFTTSSDGTIVNVSQQCLKIFGYDSVEQMYALNVRSLYAHPEEREAVMEKLIADKKIEQFECQMVKKDGTAFDALINASGKFTDGQLIEIVGVVSNNSHRKEIERQLLQAQKLESIGTLASGIAHDFNNILNNISGFSNQLKKYYTNPEKVRKYAETISQSADRGAQISTKLLSFARQKNSEIGPLNIASVISEVVEMCNDTFLRSAEIEVIQMDETIWNVYGDKSSLYQLLLNLCVNARDAIDQRSNSASPGLISITVKNFPVLDASIRWFGNKIPENAVMISVYDNGCGISDEIREKIFDPFFTTKTGDSKRGTGLGLSIVYNTVKNHHGAVTVDSEMGLGTTFTVYIPAVEVSEHSDDEATESIFNAMNNELVLLVDDEASMRQLGTELLEEAGFRVVTASNGKEAIAIYRKQYKEISLVILDLVMPELDGGQTYIEMKKINASVKAFFCSGFVTDKLISSLLSEENLKALQKPFKAEIFVKTVCDVLYG